MEKYTGLTSTTSSNLLKQNGFNEIAVTKPSSIFSIVLKVFKEPMILILFLIASIYLLLGEAQDSIALGLSVIFVIGITIYQEQKTEHALEALRELATPHATLIRDGVHLQVPSREVVVGDILVLEEGSRIVADAELLSAQNMMCDESLLTGESLPIAKSIGSRPDNLVYSGSLLVQGSGIARVTATGYHTEIGKIGKSLSILSDSEPLLKLEIARIVRVFGLVGLACCLILFLIYYYLTQDLLVSLLRGLTLSMSMLPEEFPVVMTIFLALGAWRISKNHVLTRNNQSIETLGATTVLCVDKTGTLTTNNMQLVTTIPNGVSASQLLTYAKLASKRRAFDAIEKEINHRYLTSLTTSDPLEEWSLVHTYNMSKEVTAITRIWKNPRETDFVVTAKGAPESIMSLCHMSKKDTDIWTKKISEHAEKGERILAVAKGSFKGSKFPLTQKELHYKFLGLIGFVDPIREGVKSSMDLCHRAGIRVIMITGDYPGTAISIAKQAGIKNASIIMTGAELASLSVREISQKIGKIGVFARVLPEQKLKIVEALKQSGEIVAMTGDGINDAPALKAANIGIAMGSKGTDVARESADLILLDDDFSSIVTAIKMGRRIYDNLQKAIGYIFSIHIPIAGIAIIPLFMGMPAVLYPLHIAFLELIIDPTSSIIFEVEKSEIGIMDRPPRTLSSPIFDKTHFIKGAVEGLVVLGLSMAAYIFATTNSLGEGAARFVAFITLVLCNLALIRSSLSSASIYAYRHLSLNYSFWTISAVTIGSLFAIFSFQSIRELFHFDTIPLLYLGYITLIVLFCYLLIEAIKLFKLGSNYASQN